MRQQQHLAALFAAAATLLAGTAWAQGQPQQPGNEQVIQPEVERRELRLPKFPSKDFEVGLYAGTYGTENFGASGVAGLRLGYHITEDFFVQGVFAATKVSDEAFRQIFPGGGVFPQEKEKLTYYNLSAGYNVLPGEVFLGRNRAFASQVYVIGGVGSTKFLEQKKQTFNLGFGLRVLFHDRFAWQVDLRDHVYSLDLLGKRTSTQNLELTTGFSYFF
ncbi:MAG: outer membrane beta-barrel domain-containing protein [Piscinibacter sp.]|nr:outer membrane beta-barrel domain-containing protein [Piscinibacter sp.]